MNVANLPNQVTANSRILEFLAGTMGTPGD